MSDNVSLDIAVVGLSVRLPGSRNHIEFWTHLMAERELVSFFPDEEVLRDFSLLHDPLYVRAAGLLPDYDCFDAEFFGISPRIAKMMSPEHRQFLECAWEALEDAGHIPDGAIGEVGVYGACNAENIARYKAPPEWLAANKFTTELASAWNPDSLTANVLYYLGLTGEAVTVSSYCAGFHYAAHLACQSLLLGQIDLALVGSVSVKVPQRRGYLHVPGGVMSRDGRTRPFDASGTGSIQSSGVVMAAFKRLEDALADRDHIYAVIKGSAINNSGSSAIQYGVPQPGRLAQCIASAMASGNIDPTTVSLVECYGIGHPLSDALELNALGQAFRGIERRACTVGSVKGNLGHCSTSAGGSSFAKAALALHHRQLPATLHHGTPIPELSSPDSPFRVRRESAAWEPTCGIRRAGVTALGGSGHNAHIVMQEAPTNVGSRPTRASEILTLSARTAAALSRKRSDLATYLRCNRTLPLADIAWTLNTGRRRFAHRWAAIAGTTAELIDQLSGTKTANIVGEKEAASREGQVYSPPPTVADLQAQRLLAEAWLQGYEINWDAHYHDSQARRVALPTYPLVRERHWLETGQAY